MGTFVNKLLDTTKEELFIALDDYHLVDKTELINRALDYLLEHMPYNIHFIISSRSLPRLSIAKSRAKGELLELSNDDLRFTSTEIQRLFKEIYKLDISEPLMKEMEHCFEGWVTALQLMSHLIRKDPNKALDRLKYGKENVDYFASEVFEPQPPEVRSFLVRSCILEQLTPRSCDVILRINNSREILEELIKKNLFISCIDEREEVFCYHQLFRDFLLNRLSGEESNESIVKLHLRAANYFRDIKDYNNSINHYLLAKEMKSAVELIEREGENLINTRRLDILEHWIRELPDILVQKNPVLLFYQGEILRWQGKWDEAMRVYKLAKMKFIRARKEKQSARAMLGISIILRDRGACTKAIKLAKKALEVIGDRESPFKVNILNNIAGVYFYLANYRKSISILAEGVRVCKKNGNRRQEKGLMRNILTCYMELGELDMVIDACQRLIKEEGNSPEHILGWIYATLGLCYTLKGEFSHAKEILRKALRVHKIFNDKRGIINILVKVGVLNLTMGNYELSRLYWKKALKLNIAMRESITNQLVLYDITWSYLLEGEFVKAEEHINKIPKSEIYRIYYLLRMKGEVKLEVGNFDEAEEILKLALKKTRESQNKFELMLVHAALSRLYYKKWEEKLFIKHLERTLELSKKNNYHFALLRLGRIDSSLLQFAIKKGIESHYATFLLKELYAQYNLIVKTFGGLEIWKGKEKLEEKKWKTRRAKLLFCYLLTNRKKWITRDELIELLWPGGPFSKARSNLHYNLPCIRDMVSSFTTKDVAFVEYKAECYRINPDYRIWADFEEFDGLISEAHKWESKNNERIAITAYESAVSLYKGDFLVKMYDDWSEEKRLFYKEQYLRALDKIATFYMKEQKFEKVIEYCKKIIGIDKFNENAYFMAIQSYILRGHRKAAFDLYQKLKKTLKNELNVEPSLKIKNLF